MITVVYFIRHAEPDFSVRDDMTRPLTDKGIKDARKVSQALIDRGISVVYSSPYKRSVDTIRHFAENNSLDINTIHNFRERGIGEWVDDFKAYSQKQWEDFNYKLVEGECLREVQDRNIAALLDILRMNIGKNIAVATHGTALSTIINYYNSSFGYNGFRSIANKMPYILCFTFDDMKFLSLEEIEIA